MRSKRRNAIKRRSRSKNKNNGDCADHVGREATVGIYCTDCWFSGIAKKTAGSRKNKQMLMDLWRAQAGRCAKTGALLYPGINASLDHIIPMSRYKAICGTMKGVHSLDNLQWTTLRYNLLKGDRTEEEIKAEVKLLASIL